MGLSRRTFTAEKQEGFQISLRSFGKVARRLIQQSLQVVVWLRSGTGAIRCRRRMWLTVWSDTGYPRLANAPTIRS